MEKKIAIVGSGEIGLKVAEEVARLKAEGHEVIVVDCSSIEESFPVYDRQIPLAPLFIASDYATPGKQKIDCRKGHTYVEGKCRCGKELGTIRY
jgi:3-hydroxyacyl-CoA dehydrogenase